MTVDRIKNIISQGEGIETEFKTAGFSLPIDTFETVSAFLNRNGGDLLLGVEDNGTIAGVYEDSINKIKSEFASGCNDTNQLNPTYYLSVQDFEIEGKKILYIRVPESSQVHKSKGKIFDRNEDGDFNITDNSELVSQLYIRKTSTYTENKIYERLTLSDFKPALFDQVRKLARNQTPGHPWLSLSDEDLLKSAGLWKKDYSNGLEGYTLAAVLLLGKEEVITNILPHYKTDAILRVENIDRYDDRDDVRCNLIEAYERLMSFIKKHLPEGFYKENNQRINLRDTIFHEIVGNLLIHREYTNAFPAKLIIENEKVITENSNKPHGNGEIDLSNFSPFPKNPIIAKFFKQIGYAEELGSGIRNTAKYSRYYGKKEPIFIEADEFKAVIPIPSLKEIKPKSEGITPKFEGVNPEFEGVFSKIEGVIDDDEKIKSATNKILKKIIKFLLEKPAVNATEIAREINKSEKSVERYMKTLRTKNIVEYKGSPKKGGYVITNRFTD